MGVGRIAISMPSASAQATVGMLMYQFLSITRLVYQDQPEKAYSEPGSVTVLTDDEVAQQLQLLETYRRTLNFSLNQAALFGEVNTPPHIIHTIHDCRDQIQRIKATLRGYGISIEDGPNDEAKSKSVDSTDPNLLFIDQALSLLQIRNYTGALQKLSHISTASARYYSVLARLKGEEPRRRTRNDMRQIENELELAWALDATQAHYCYLWAWVKADYSEEHDWYIPPPPSVEELLRRTRMLEKNNLAMQELISLAPKIRNWLNRL
jgi:hypothetical protein